MGKKQEGKARRRDLLRQSVDGNLGTKAKTNHRPPKAGTNDSNLAKDTLNKRVLQQDIEKWETWIQQDVYDAVTSPAFDVFIKSFETGQITTDIKHQWLAVMAKFLKHHTSTELGDQTLSNKIQGAYKKVFDDLYQKQVSRLETAARKLSDKLQDEECQTIQTKSIAYFIREKMDQADATDLSNVLPVHNADKITLWVDKNYQREEIAELEWQTYRAWKACRKFANKYSNGKKFAQENINDTLGSLYKSNSFLSFMQAQFLVGFKYTKHDPQNGRVIDYATAIAISKQIYNSKNMSKHANYHTGTIMGRNEKKEWTVEERGIKMRPYDQMSLFFARAEFTQELTYMRPIVQTIIEEKLSDIRNSQHGERLIDDICPKPEKVSDDGNVDTKEKLHEFVKGDDDVKLGILTEYMITYVYPGTSAESREQVVTQLSDILDDVDIDVVCLLYPDKFPPVENLNVLNDLGKQIHKKILERCGELTGKITGMFLGTNDNACIKTLLGDNPQQVEDLVNQAKIALVTHCLNDGMHSNDSSQTGQLNFTSIKLVRIAYPDMQKIRNIPKIENYKERIQPKIVDAIQHIEPKHAYEISKMIFANCEANGCSEMQQVLKGNDEEISSIVQKYTVILENEELSGAHTEVFNSESSASHVKEW